MNRVIIICSLIVLVFSACNSEQKVSPISLTQEVIVDSVPGECPYLTKDVKGNTILSWVRLNSDSTTSFCYAALNSDNSFANKTVIPGSGNIQPHGENLPKIIFKPSGEIIALWGGANPNPNNKYSGLVFYVQSFDDGKTWTDPKPLVTDTASYDQRYYDVALLPNGEAGIIWLDNRKTSTREGSGLFFAWTEGKNGFLNDRLIGEPCCQCCRTDLFVDSKGYMHVLYRGILQDSIRDMVHIVSTDKGNSFSTPKRISEDNWIINGCPHTGPAMTETSDGLQFAWFTGGKQKGCFYSYSKDNGLSFAPRSAISEFGSHPQLTSFSNNDVIVVWDESVQVDNKYYKKIGIQKRNEKSGNLTKDFITSDTLSSTYPVINSLSQNKSIVAYLAKKTNKNYIAYQVIKY